MRDEHLGFFFRMNCCGRVSAEGGMPKGSMPIVLVDDPWHDDPLHRPLHGELHGLGRCV
tara:strand:- start:27 stop:203 length:177 start_codon:yes stop_codon:yes gene_type:complete